MFITIATLVTASSIGVAVLAPLVALTFGLDTLLAPLLGPALAQVLTLLLGQGLFAVGIPWLLRLAGERGWVPGLSKYSPFIQKVCVAVVSAAATAGITSGLDLEAGTFVINGITIDGLGKFGHHFVTTLGLQELGFQWLTKRKAA